jgi:hypothetical protein
VELLIWISIIVVTILSTVLALLTSVTKWGDKMVDKYEKDGTLIKKKKSKQ